MPPDMNENINKFMSGDLPKPSEIANICAKSYVGPWTWVVGDIKVYSENIGKYLVVAVRGTTKNGEDILRDIRFLPWWDSMVGFGPGGFMKAARDILDDTRFMLDVSEHLRSGTLIIAGHSMGGAVALILGAWLLALGTPLAAIYAFEPARCGWFKMRRQWRNTTVFCSWDGNDRVPNLPFFYLLPKEITYIGTRRTYWPRCHRIMTVITDLLAKGL